MGVGRVVAVPVVGWVGWVEGGVGANGNKGSCSVRTLYETRVRLGDVRWVGGGWGVGCGVWGVGCGV